MKLAPLRTWLAPSQDDRNRVLALVDVDFWVDCCRACAGLEPVSPIPCPIAIECEADPPNRLRQIVEHESCRKTQHPVVVRAHHLVASIVLGATFTVFLPVDLNDKPTSSAVEVSPPAKNLPLPNKAESIDRSPSNLRPDTTFGIRGLTPTRVGRGVLLLRRQWRRTVLGTARGRCVGGRSEFVKQTPPPSSSTGRHHHTWRSSSMGSTGSSIPSDTTSSSQASGSTPSTRARRRASRRFRST